MQLLVTPMQLQPEIFSTTCKVVKALAMMLVSSMSASFCDILATDVNITEISYGMTTNNISQATT